MFRIFIMLIIASFLTACASSGPSSSSPSSAPTVTSPAPSPSISPGSASGTTSSKTVGRDFDTTHVNDIKVGMQTKSQIRTWFGDPFKSATSLTNHPKGCTERWIYVYAINSPTVVRSHALVVDFDNMGIVCDHGYASE